MIAEETIQEVLDRASITEVVGEVVQLKRAGTNFVGLCPFHSEKTPSFNVRENEGYFHCFGCGQSGNVFKFLMETKGLSFPEAVEELAGKYGVQLRFQGNRQPKGPTTNQKDLIFRVNAVAQQFFTRSLTEAPPQVVDYVKKRAIAPASIKTFGIGFAPNSRRALYDFLIAKKVPEDLIFQAALARRNEQGEVYDVFRGRLIFPVWLDQKKIAGFGGRIIPPLFDPQVLDRYPKYLNSPETPVYQKSKILYGIPQALNDFRTRGEACIVEGYMDVVSMHQAKVCNTLATCGTALTELHVKKLGQLVKKVTVLFDGDEAGRNAAGKSFPTFLNSGIDVAALFLPAEDDPDTIALAYGDKSGEYLAGLPRKSLLDCHIEYLLGKLGVKEVRELGSALKGKLAEELAAVLHRVRNGVERSEYIERTSLLLRLEKRELERMVEGAKESPKGETPEGLSVEDDETSEESSLAQIQDLSRVDQELLLCAMALKESIPSKILRDADVCLALHPRSLAFIEGLAQIVADLTVDEGGKKEKLKGLLRGFGDSWVKHWKRSHELLKVQSVKPQEAFEECRRAIKKAKLMQTVREIDREIALADTEAGKLELMQRKVALGRQITALGAKPG